MANPAGDALSVFPGGSSGNAPSLVTNPGLASPSAIARDGAGNMCVANPVSSSITVYGAGASGNSSPTAAITGSSTGSTIQLASPSIRAETSMSLTQAVPTVAPIISSSTPRQ